MIENTNTKQFYPGPILNNTLEITDFLFNDAEQIKIKHSKLNEEGILVDVDLNYPTDYEVTKVLPSDINAAEAALTASTGQIMLKNVNVLAGEKLTVYRVSLIIQDKDYPRTGAFPAATHEGALDYLTMQNQEQKDEIDRALKVPVSTEGFSGSLPVPIPARALKINNDGTGFEMSEFDPDLALVTTEEFKNQSQQAAAEAKASEIAAANSAAGAKASENTAINKATEVVELGTTAVNDINEAYDFVNEWFRKLNAIPYIPVGTILPTTGAIDESLGYQRYANGQLITGVSVVAPDLVKFLEFQEAHAPNLLCSETEWQTALTLSTLGQVGKYVWNKKEDSIRIPRIVNIQGMMDMNTVGNRIEAGLPNISGQFGAGFTQGNLFNQGYGAFGTFRTEYANTTVPQDSKIQYANNNMWDFYASRSNPIYGNSNTVQEESILYPYVLQIATGVQYKTPVQNEIELNNPFFFGMGQYFEAEPNNISWLKSNGQWNSRASYTDYYEWVLTNANKGKANFIGQNMYGWGSSDMYYLTSTPNVEVGSAAYGGSSKRAVAVVTEINKETGTITLYNPAQNKYEENLPRYTPQDRPSLEFINDYHWVINPAEETFRLPLLNGSEDLPGNRFDNVLSKVTGTPTIFVAPANGWYYADGIATSSGGWLFFHNDTASMGGCFDRNYYANSTNRVVQYVKKGDTVRLEYGGLTVNYCRFIYAQGNGALYFYVGETVQNANLINAGRIEEKVASLITIVETYVNGTSGYNVYSNGYCEQWGMKQLNNAGTAVQLLKAYKDTSFCVLLTCGSNTTGWPIAWTGNVHKTNSSFAVDGTGDYSKAERTIQINWKTCGYVR